MFEGKLYEAGKSYELSDVEKLNIGKFFTGVTAPAPTPKVEEAPAEEPKVEEEVKSEPETEEQAVEEAPQPQKKKSKKARRK